jgi:hypothetical protein
MKDDPHTQLCIPHKHLLSSFPVNGSPYLYVRPQRPLPLSMSPNHMRPLYTLLPRILRRLNHPCASALGAHIEQHTLSLLLQEDLQHRSHVLLTLECGLKVWHCTDEEVDNSQVLYLSIGPRLHVLGYA